jgi:hypothetical protein
VSTAPLQRGRSNAGSDEPSTLHVDVTFREVEPQQADAIAAALIGHVHELANTPEYECDVDVSVRTTSPEDDGAHGSGAL